MLQLVLTGVLYLILVIPVGRYLYHIAAGKHTFADPVLDRIDDVIYKIVGVDPHRGMNWRQYALALIGTACGRGEDRHWLPNPAYPKHWDLQPQPYWKHGAVAGLQHHHQFHDKYEPSALLR